jgi:molybdopterin molybdotransferase
MLSIEDARQQVIQAAAAQRLATVRAFALVCESVELDQAPGRVLAEEVSADRDYPPFNRATRDGFALQAEDVSRVPAELHIIGECAAGAAFSGRVAAGECVQIMTGAPLPDGTDAVVMIEHSSARGFSGGSLVTIQENTHPGQNVVPRGSEGRAGDVLLRPGMRLGYSELGLAAQVGRTKLQVHRQPRVAILSTGDEIVPVGATPGPWEIRNSNGVSLAAQVWLAAGVPVPLGNAPDRKLELRAMIERGLEEDILVISGGVSMGKYDLVEGVLMELGADLFFDAVAIRPGKPAVLARCREKLVFGLPGNPVSTMVTFELLVTPALDLLGGAEPRPIGTLGARLEHGVDEEAPLTHFLPAKITWREGEPWVQTLPWQQSGDVVTLASANCFLVVPESRRKMAQGEWGQVLPRRGVQ